MNCAESEVLVHALLDGELDAGHAREVETHVATCATCRDKLTAFRAMRAAMAEARLKEIAPASLRGRIEASLSSPQPSTDGADRFTPWFRRWRSARRTFFGGFALGATLSAAVAASLAVAVIRDDRERTIASEIVSAHLRSLQAGHLTDVETSEQHTVKPWFNGKLDVAPPVVDLTAQGFTLIGGRLDYIDGAPAGSIIYRRRNHIINLFVARNVHAPHGGPTVETMQGFNVLHWSEGDLDFWAVSDINAAELREFSQKFMAARQLPNSHS